MSSKIKEGESTSGTFGLSLDQFIGLVEEKHVNLGKT